MKIGFIGFGNMGQAIAKGFIKKEALKAEDIYANDINLDKLYKDTKAYGFNPVEDAKELVKAVDMVVIGVKPYLVEEVVGAIKEELKGKVLVQVAVNWPFEKVEKIVDPSTHHISTAPNTPVAVGEGVIGYEDKHNLTDDELKDFIELFSKIGLVVETETKNLYVIGTVAGCGPAFTSMYIEALGDAGVKYGLPRDLSYKIVSQMLVGTGTLQLESGDHPGAMKDAVCSPGGTTIKGVSALEQNNFRGATIAAIDAVLGDK